VNGYTKILKILLTEEVNVNQSSKVCFICLKEFLTVSRAPSRWHFCFHFLKMESILKESVSPHLTFLSTPLSKTLPLSVKNDRTALHFAAQNCQHGCMEILLAFGADVNKTSEVIE
jgi:ankyrin repeat protein